MYTKIRNIIQLLGFSVFFIAASVLWFTLPKTSVDAATAKPSVSINKNARSTSDRFVTLTFVSPTNTTHMRIGNSREEVARAEWRIYRSELENWYLSEGSGRKTIYVEFRDRYNFTSPLYEDTIVYFLNQEGYLIINDEDAETANPSVNLQIGLPKNVRRMRISNSLPLDTVEWRKTAGSLRWRLTDGLGPKTVYAQFEYTELDTNREYKKSNIFQDSIMVVNRVVEKPDFTINNGARETTDPRVTLLFTYPPGTRSFLVSNTSTFVGGVWRTPRQAVPWTLENRSGTHTVFVQFFTLNQTTTTVKHAITYKPSVSAQRPQVRANTLVPGVVTKDTEGRMFYVGHDGLLHLMSRTVFDSWFPSEESVQTVTPAEVNRYTIGTPVCVRPGTWLVKFPGDARVFAVSYGCRLHHIRSETEAYLLYGSQWLGRLVQLPVTDRSLYTIVPGNGSVLAVSDFDGDGLDTDTETEFGSNDRRSDSDNDKLSDYEEVVYWLTNPTKADTNGNGVSDGDDIIAGRSPTTGGKLRSLPKNSYTYPYGAIILSGTNSYAYRAPSGFYSLGRANSELFLLGNNQTRFAVKPLYRSLITGSVRTQKTFDPLTSYPAVYDGVGVNLRQQ
jgi:hypothetical protein